MSLPERGTEWPELSKRMQELRVDDVDWRGGRSALHVYFAGDEVLEVAQKAYAMFMCENVLAPAAFPGVKRMGDDIVGMALDLLGAGPGAAGSLTSGGTESIILAVRAAVRWYAQSGRLSPRTHLLLPESAHPAFDKAAELMALQVRRYPIDASYRASVSQLVEHLDADTMMTVASVPSLPFGTIDPVEEIARISREHDIWLHVDACIGGFLAPFAKTLTNEIPGFDLRVAGVRSLSADLHKYGYAAKGASVILYNDAADHSRQWFDFAAWPKGIYRTETLAGTRSGGTVAAAWAVMHFLGRDGYLALTRRVIETRKRLQRGILALPGFRLLGVQPLGVVSFHNEEIDIFAIADQMEARGWYVSRVASPPALQLTVAPQHEAIVDTYLRDLQDSAAFVSRNRVAGSNRPVVTY